MSQKMGLLGKKVGMTQIFTDDGEAVPVSVVQAGPCFVVGKRTVDRDGYSAVVVGFDERPKRHIRRAEAGSFKEGLKPQRVLREFRLEAKEVEAFTVGQTLALADVFKPGAPVDVIGTSKGKGFQGVIKMHHMKGMKNTHGTHEYFRHGGSIGCRLTPQKVHKGKRMSGHMGAERVTVQNLELVKIMAEENCLLIRGAIPGAPNDYVVVANAATRNEYKRKGVGKEETRSKNPLKASKKAAAGRG